MHFPSSEKELLAGVVAGLKKRSRALKYKNVVIVCEKVFEVHDGSRKERFELSFRGKSAELRTHVWEDYWIWVDFRARANSGWRWEWSYDGRLLPRHDGGTLVEALERTLDASVLMDPVDVSEFSAIWKPLLAQGPRSVRD